LVASATTTYATTFAASPGGNQSGSPTAIQQVQTNQSQAFQKQLPNLNFPVACYDPEDLGLTPTCGNINAIELLTNRSPDYIFQNYMQTFAPVAVDPTDPNRVRNSLMFFTDAVNPSAPINVTQPGQILKINLRGWLNSTAQDPFFVLTERVDTSNHIISAVTLKGHPLAGWRYWRVYSIGTNDVVIETGAYDEPGPGAKNFVGHYIAQGDVLKGWKEYMQYIQSQVQAPLGNSLKNTLGGNKIQAFPWETIDLTKGYWDYSGQFTNYILNNVCQSTSCN
jgi:hypothetical protein